LSTIGCILVFLEINSLDVLTFKFLKQNLSE